MYMPLAAKGIIYLSFVIIVNSEELVLDDENFVDWKGGRNHDVKIGGFDFFDEIVLGNTIIENINEFTWYICAENELIQSDQKERASWKMIMYAIAPTIFCLSVLVILLVLLYRKYRQRNQKLDISKTWIIERVLNYSKGSWPSQQTLFVLIFTLLLCLSEPGPRPRLWLWTPGSGSAQFSSWRGKTRWVWNSKEVLTCLAV